MVKHKMKILLVPLFSIVLSKSLPDHWLDKDLTNDQVFDNIENTLDKIIKSSLDSKKRIE